MHRKKPMFYSAVLLTLVNLILRLVGTGFQVYLSGRIGAAGIGLLQLLLSVGSLSMIAAMAGIRTATMYLTSAELGSGHPERVGSILTRCSIYSLLCSGCASILLFLSAPRIAHMWIGQSDCAPALRLFALFLPVSCLCGVFTGYFTSAGRIGALAAVEVAEQLLCMAVTVGALGLWAGTDTLRACQSVIFGSGVGACLTLACLFTLRCREKAPGSGWRLPARRLLDAAAPLALADDLKAGISTLENLMVPRRLSLYPGTADPLALFGTVCGMVFPVMMFPAALLFGLAELLIPELARCRAAGSERRIRYLSRRSLKVSMLYGMCVWGFLFLFGQPLCRRLYGSEEAGALLRLFSFLVPMLYCDAITDAMTKGLGQQKICVRYNILTSGLDVLFLFFLLPRWGMRGYIVSFAVTHILNFILSLRLLLKITRQRLSPRTPLLTILSAGLSAALCIPCGTLWLRAVCFPAAFISLLVLLRVLDGEDLQWLRGLLLGKKQEPPVSRQLL